MSIVKNRGKIKYYIGVDIGTNSVGWAVIDENGYLLTKENIIYGDHACLIKHKLRKIVEIIVRHVEDIINEKNELGYYK